MDISYPHQWSDIHHDWTYAVLILSKTTIRDGVNGAVLYLWDENYILEEKQPRGQNRPSAILTTTNTGVNQNEIDFFNDIEKISFSNIREKYLIYTKTIEEHKKSNLLTILNHSKTTITTYYRQEYPLEKDCDDIVLMI